MKLKMLVSVALLAALPAAAQITHYASCNSTYTGGHERQRKFRFGADGRSRGFRAGGGFAARGNEGRRTQERRGAMKRPLANSRSRGV